MEFRSGYKKIYFEQISIDNFFWWKKYIIYLGYIPKSGIAGSLCKFTESVDTVFQSFNMIAKHSHRQKGVPGNRDPCPLLVSSLNIIFYTVYQ